MAGQHPGIGEHGQAHRGPRHRQGEPGAWRRHQGRARDAERLVIAETLDRVHWNRAKAARILQISYKALLYKIVDCGLGPKAEPASAAVSTTLVA